MAEVAVRRRLSMLLCLVEVLPVRLMRLGLGYGLMTLRCLIVGVPRVRLRLGRRVFGLAGTLVIGFESRRLVLFILIVVERGSYGDITIFASLGEGGLASGYCGIYVLVD